MVNLPLDNLQFPLFPGNEFFLPFQLFLDDINIPVMKKFRNFVKGQIQHSEIPYGVQHLELPSAVIAVSRLRVCVFRVKKSRLLIMAERSRAHLEHLCHITDPE